MMSIGAATEPPGYQCSMCESGWGTRQEAVNCCRVAKEEELDGRLKQDIDRAMAEIASEARVERLYADVIDRVERHINQFHGGDTDMRSLIRVILKQIGRGHQQRQTEK